MADPRIHFVEAGVNVTRAVCGAVPAIWTDDRSHYFNQQKSQRCADCDLIALIGPGRPRSLLPDRQPSDAVNHPRHYTAGCVECIDAIEAAVINLKGKEAFLTAQVLKYLWRWDAKNGLEDLQKADWYLTRLRKHVEARKAPSEPAKIVKF